MGLCGSCDNLSDSFCSVVIVLFRGFETKDSRACKSCLPKKLLVCATQVNKFDLAVFATTSLLLAAAQMDLCKNRIGNG